MSSDDPLSLSAEDESSSSAYSARPPSQQSRRSVRKRLTSKPPSENFSQDAQHDSDLEAIFGGEPIVFKDRESDSSVYAPSDWTPSPASVDEEALVHSASNSDDSLLGVSRKRTASARRSFTSLDYDPEASPSKRLKFSGPYNEAYLELLNEDLEHAEAFEVPHDYPPLYESQIGLSVWTAEEKELFFEALSRLGRDDVAGIAARMKQKKSELEVRQYLVVLQDALEERRRTGQLEPVVMGDIPAAVELSVRCCYALDQAAEGLLNREDEETESAQDEILDLLESMEDGAVDIVESIERDGSVNILQSIEVDDEPGDEGQNEEEELAQSILKVKAELEAEPSDEEGDINGDLGEFSPDQTQEEELFDVQELEGLSSRIFLNAPFADGNWRSYSDTPPNVELESLRDMHTVTVSILRRLMAASLFMARSRLRQLRVVKPDARSVVKRDDVRAAARSLGLDTDFRVGWVGMPRRLKLSVYEHPPRVHVEGDTEEEEEPLNYRTVEEVLSKHIEDYSPPFRDRQLRVSDDDDSSGTDDVLLEKREDTMERMFPDFDNESLLLDDSDLDADDDLTSDSADSSKSKPRSRKRRKRNRKHDPELWAEARRELYELMMFASVGIPDTRDVQHTIIRRIMSELQQEAHAEELDQAASAAEEREMWVILGEEPPEELLQPVKEQDEPIDEMWLKKRPGIEELLWPNGGGGRDWRARMKWKDKFEEFGRSKRRIR